MNILPGNIFRTEQARQQTGLRTVTLLEVQFSHKEKIQSGLHFLSLFIQVKEKLDVVVPILKAGTGMDGWNLLKGRF